jgi:hypothetical protein
VTGSSPAVTAKPTPAVTGHWEDAGSMRLGRYAPHAVRLGDAEVLVVGNDTGDCLRDNSTVTEVWHREGRWPDYAAPLPEPRADFVAITLADGRVLVTGGVNRGKTRNLYRLAETIPGERPPDAGHRSFASTWVYAPAETEPRWTKAAPMGTARTSPVAAVLPDGRVLVAGGYYLGAVQAETDTDTDPDPATPATLAVHRAGERPGTGHRTPVLDNDGPAPYLVPAIATAELYDPATDTWSDTGPMRYARYDAAAVTLADGRVLVVGSGSGPWAGLRWNFSEVETDERVPVTTEVYDPATGRFSLTGEVPPTDWSALEALGHDGFRVYAASAGTLLALPGGGALLVGRVERWDAASTGGNVVRTLRYDSVTGTWSEVDRTIEVLWQEDGEGSVPVDGHTHDLAIAAVLADGRVLVAGGRHLAPPDNLVALDTAELYDPATNLWTALPPMPLPRAGGAAVSLADGSILLVGGTYEMERSLDCSEGPTGLVTTIRFVPGP